MRKFTHGIIAVDPITEDGSTQMNIVHFIGLWQEPTKEEFKQYEKEIKTDPEFGLVEIANRLIITLAPKEFIDYYNDLVADIDENDIEE